MADRTYTPRHMRRTPETTALPAWAHGTYVALTLALLVAPCALMPFVSADVAQEKRELAETPQLVVDGRLNVDVLSDAGDYLADHFAFRSALVEADATLRERLLMTSSVDNVVVGTEGWLYYAGELADYRRENLMSEAAIANAAHNLALVQEYLAGLGKRLVVVVAPNKSTVVPAHLPYYELAGVGPTNLTRLQEALSASGVTFVDATPLLSEDLYFHRDSHWNDAGALVVAREILAALGGEHVLGEAPEVEDEHIGDLEAMLHPLASTPERQVTHAWPYAIANDASSVEDGYIVTSGGEGAQGSLLVYRDSFANNLLAPLASVYAQAVFTKLVPYDLGTAQVSFAADVVVERAERHLSSFATDPPYLPALERLVQVVEGPAGSATLYLERKDPYLVVEGTLAEPLSATGSEAYVEVTYADGGVRTFCCLYVSEGSDVASDFEGQQGASDAHIVGDAGYRAYVPLEEGREVVQVRTLVGQGGVASPVAAWTV